MKNAFGIKDSRALKDLHILNAAAISPLGTSLETIWRKVLAGRSVFGEARLPGGRRYFVAETTPGSASDIAKYGPKFYAAMRQLVDELSIEEPVDAIFLATAVGNLADVENTVYGGHAATTEQLDFSALERVFRSTAAFGPATRFVCVPTGCCAGLQALGFARSAMTRLGLETAIVMSVDFGLTPLALEAFRKINATRAFNANLNSSPSRPFCADRGGFLFADGGGALLVSTQAPPQPVPKITGYGCVSSAFHMTDIATDGHAIRDSIMRALADAGRDGGDIDHVNLHASGTEQNDTAEYRAVSEVIGAELPPITAFKGNHGHALGGANLIEMALAWKMLTEGLLPPSPENLPVDAFADVPPRVAAQPYLGHCLLKTASGFSGIHAAVVMEV